MRKLFFFILTFTAIVTAVGQEAEYVQQYSWPWHWREGTIVTEPAPATEGQRTAIGMAAPAIDTVRVGFVGLGMRGSDAVRRFTHIEGVRIAALCDYEADRVEASSRFLREAGLPPAACYSGEEGYKALCANPDIDLVYVATDWHHHFLVAKCAIEHGKHAAVEVPSAMTLTECWALVNLVEQRRRHCVILENCCYDEFELNTLHMAQQGLFGEIVRVQGAYIHTLDEYWMQYWKQGPEDRLGWRLRWNRDYAGDVYPTHGLGPVAQLLDIHRGDRMATLTAMATASFRGRELAEQYGGEPCPDFKNGDHTTTLIRTVKGKVIEIQHNVMTPQPYSRLYQLTGTRGFANKYPTEGYYLYDGTYSHRFLTDSARAALEARYRSPLLAEYAEKAHRVGGHGGMDYTMDARLIYCLRNGLPTDMDVYDLAEWCSLAELGALSLEHGSAPVEFPDFTRGHWQDLKGFRHWQKK